ncbi:MAG: bifunctional biotin--[acetyl-CoA-carboxylase] synthetase/biotin operon repressor, partial [Thermus caldifontis]
MPSLLDLLTEAYQSGEALAQKLGVSRQAVSK